MNILNLRNNWGKGLFCLVLGFCLVFSSYQQVFATAGINRNINFQGKLTNIDGTNVADATYTIRFGLYNDPTLGTDTAGCTGNCLWTENNTSVTTKDGIFQVQLGSVTSFASSSVDFNQTALYLGVKVGSDAEMTPRVQMAAVPYALTAEKVSGLTVTNNGGNTLNIAANKTFTVSNTITLTGTDTNTYAFPSVNNGTVLTTNQTSQTVNSGQTSGTILALAAGAPSLSGALTGLSVTLNGTGGQNETGLSFAVTAAGGTKTDILGTSSNWQVLSSGVGTFASGTVIGSQTFTTNNIVDSGALTIKSASGNALTLDTNGGTAAVNLGNTNATSVVIGNTANTATATLNTSATSGTGITIAANGVNTGIALSLSDTALTSGTALNITAPNPSTLTTGKLLNIANATGTRTYAALTQRDFTLGGHKNNIGSLTGVNQVYIYDTAKDIDGGRWINDERAKSSSWYNEAASSKRSANSAFPAKAILVAANDNVYIYDGKDNSLWMEFDQATTTALGVALNNEVSSVTALNGQIVVGTNGSAATGMYVIDFIKDKITRYNTTDARDYAGTIAARNTAQTGTNGDYPNQSRTAVALPNNNQVNDLTINVVNGKTFIGAATGTAAQATQTNGPAVLINETQQTEADFGVTTANFQATHVFLTERGDLYYSIGESANPTNFWLKAAHKADLASGHNNLASVNGGEVYANNSVGATTYGVSTTDAASPTFTNGPAPINNTFVPNQIFVTTGTSDADGVGNTVYVANSSGLMVLNENRTTPSQGSAKQYNSTKITEELYGNISGAWNFSEASGNFADSSPRGNSLTAGAGITYGASGVRGKAVTFTAGTHNSTSTAADLLFPYSTAALTVSAWVKPNTVTNTSGTRESLVTSDKNIANVVSWGFGTKGNGTDAIFTCWSGSSADALTEVSTNIAAQTGNWYHIAETISAGGAVSCYVNGQLVATGAGAATGETPTRFQVGQTQATTNISAVRATYDNVFVTKQLLTAAQIKHEYDVGYRAQQAINHTGNTIRGAAISADAHNNLNGNTVGAGVSVDMERGLIYVATSNGVSVLGQYSDSLTDVITTSATDDNAAALGSNTTTSVSSAKGYGTGGMFAIGFATGLWIESADTTFKDFLAQDYNPFGSSLTQSNINVDTTLRVVGQLTSRDDNMVFNGTNQPAITEAFRVDSNGNFLSKSLINSTTAMQFQENSGFTVLNMDTINHRIGINTTSPANALDVRGSSGTTAVASVSGQTAFASLIVNNDGVGDVLSASSSSIPIFQLKNTGALILGNSSNGLTLDPVNNGPLYAGTARPLKTIVLSAEYAGAVLTASGSATITGSMTSDASPSATPTSFDWENYYEWKSTQTSLNDYTVAVAVTLPKDFSAWQTSVNAITVAFNTLLTTSADNALDVYIYKAGDTTGSPVAFSINNASGTAKNWTTVNITNAQLTGGPQTWNTAGATAIFYLKMHAKNTTNYVQVGDITLNYLSKF